MARSRLFVGSLTLAFALAGWAALSRAATPEEVVAAAKKEGVIEFYAPSTLTPKGAQELAAAFNKKHDLNVKVEFSPAGNMVRDVSKAVTAAATGSPPEWDIMLVTDAHHATLWLRKLHQAFDYAKLGVDPKLIHYDRGAVGVSNQFVIPAYNSKVVGAKDVPKSWEDLLDPKWKGGKLGISTATHHFARLAVGGWGEERATKYVKALAEQKPNLGTPGEVHARLELGEVSIYVNEINTFIARAKREGAPVVSAEGVEPVISPADQAGVLKGAKHPNVGHLFVAFLLTPEAQEIWQRYTALSSAFIPGTPMFKFVQGKKMLYMRDDQAQTVDKLATEYGKILGFR